MRHLTLRPLLNSHLGFDNLFEELERTFNSGVAAPSYPPFNILKDSDGYTLELAIAGFKKGDVKIEHDRKNQCLNIASNQAKQEQNPAQEVVQRGLARRAFNLNFKVANDLEVRNANLEDGILTITLKTIQREEDKPLLIAVN